MISRVADHCFWFGRYLERTESTARVLFVTRNLALDTELSDQRGAWDMLPDGSYGGNPCGFVVESSDGNFYYSGDTALTSDMKLIGEGTKLSFAIFPIGDFFTMGIGDALRAAEFVGFVAPRLHRRRPYRYSKG